MEWEAYNHNTAKGMTGTFSTEGVYLRWQSDDGQENMFIEVKDIVMNEEKMYVRHRSGLQYYFEKVEDHNGKKGQIGRGNSSHSNGTRNKKITQRSG